MLARDTHEAIALAAKASPDDDPRPLAALTVDELKAMTETLEQLPFNDTHRVEFSLDGYTTSEQVEKVAAEWKGCAVQQESEKGFPEPGINPSKHLTDADTDVLSIEQNALAELEEILEPLVDLLNQKYRGAWDKEFRICHEARFRPLKDADCALIELPEDPDMYPEIANVLRELVTQSEACIHPYRGRPDGDGPVCGPCRFSVQTKAYSDDGCSYVYGTHLVVERQDLEGQAAKRQIAYLYRELRDHQTPSLARSLSTVPVPTTASIATSIAESSPALDCAPSSSGRQICPSQDATTDDEPEPVTAVSPPELKAADAPSMGASVRPSFPGTIFQLVDNSIVAVANTEEGDIIPGQKLRVALHTCSLHCLRDTTGPDVRALRQRFALAAAEMLNRLRKAVLSVPAQRVWQEFCAANRILEREMKWS